MAGRHQARVVLRPASSAPSGRGSPLIVAQGRGGNVRAGARSAATRRTSARGTGLEKPRADGPTGQAGDVHARRGRVVLGRGRRASRREAEECRRRVSEELMQRRQLDDVGGHGRAPCRGRGPPSGLSRRATAPPTRCVEPTGPPISLSGSKHARRRLARMLDLESTGTSLRASWHRGQDGLVELGGGTASNHLVGADVMTLRTTTRWSRRPARSRIDSAPRRGSDRRAGNQGREVVAGEPSAPKADWSMPRRQTTRNGTSGVGQRGHRDPARKKSARPTLSRGARRAASRHRRTPGAPTRLALSSDDRPPHQDRSRAAICHPVPLSGEEGEQAGRSVRPTRPAGGSTWRRWPARSGNP